MQQYLGLKRQHPQALLLFRLGDFYELFYEDAIIAARELQITLTSRSRERGQAVPMCGVPYHAADTYIARLIRAGFKVAICEQMEEPGPGKKLVRRDVVRVVTPGTATDLQMLAPRENNFLVSVAPHSQGEAIGFAFLDLSTGEFRATEFRGPSAEACLRDEIELLRPREVLLPRVDSLFPALPLDLSAKGTTETRLDECVFEPAEASRLLARQFRVISLDGFGLDGHSQATGAAGAILHYLQQTASLTSAASGGSATLAHVNSISFYEQRDSLALDSSTVRNLELLEPASDGDASATLVHCLDETATGMGARLLRSWILRPSIRRDEIESRLEAVAFLKDGTFARDEIHRELGGMLDIERLTSRAVMGTATPRDLAALLRSLDRIPVVRGFLTPAPDGPARLDELHAGLDEMPELRERISRTLADDPPALATDPNIIRPGYSGELDELRALSHDGRRIIAGMEERERARTRIGSLKIRYNQVFGYYIEITKANLHLVPEDYERKQTLVGAERFTCTELKEYERKVLSADERIVQIERRLFTELRGAVVAEAPRLRLTAGAIAQLDVLVTFARLAASRGYTRPEFTETVPPSSVSPVVAGIPRGDLLIAAGRHPVIENLLARRGERFVPNDLYLDDKSQFLLLITGPNMGGKSTYLRQTALIVLMAQMGSYVSADRARLPLVDRIFTRIGASDNLARGRSTFLVEMSEVAVILNSATPASLVLLDEVGRGTATFDGLSIAWAVVEALQGGLRPRTLFATHYHELTELEDLLPGIHNVHVTVRESGPDIVFLRRVEPGSADKSYGIEVARLAGLPPSVVARAREVLARHEQSEHRLSEELSPGGTVAPHQEVMFTPVDAGVLQSLREAELDRLSPLEALNLLASLRKQLLS
jgi:DNA mismatch repair protein MutS